MSRLVTIDTAETHPAPGTRVLADRVTEIVRQIREEYQSAGDDPWLLAYSGGKDSTLLLQFTWEAIQESPPALRSRKVYVVGNDTLVESPLVIDHLRSSLENIKRAADRYNLPIEIRITKPNIDQTFWVNVIGRGYIPPTRNFRWCTDRMKIMPTNTLINSIMRRYRRTVLLVGSRKSESTARRRTIEKYQEQDTRMNPHSTIAGCDMFAPLADLEDNDVWLLLMQRDPPWGGTHDHLITLYRNAGGGECPLILSKHDAPSCGTTSPRFGCWTCTVVNKDRSLQGLINSGHQRADYFEKLFDFREWLVDLRENESNRLRVRRNGVVKLREDGSRVLGPFKLDVRREILDRLRALQNELGEHLISRSEIRIIEDIWRRDQVHEDCREALRKTYTKHQGGKSQ